jgi:hypothetical protein
VDSSSQKPESSPFGIELAGAALQRVVAIRGVGKAERRLIRNDVLQNASRLMTA